MYGRLANKGRENTPNRSCVYRLGKEKHSLINQLESIEDEVYGNCLVIGWPHCFILF